MSIAINQPIQQKPLSFEEFLALYSGDNRYELIRERTAKDAKDTKK
jgi:hypothetical protein